MVTLKQVLCPVDLSELSIDALACGSSIAERYRSELIVLGAHGRGGPAATPLGPTTEHVVRAAPCPVLMVRPSRGHMSEQGGRHVSGL
jgi:hypothetical protein